MRPFPPVSPVRKLLLALLLAITLWQAPAALAQVAIYDLTFQRPDERSINFSSFDGGYLILDVITGRGSFLLTYREIRDGSPQPCFVQAKEAAQAFTAVRDSGRKTVVRASAGNGSSVVHYLATGGVDHQISVQAAGKPVEVQIASLLTGQILASDDESDVEFSPGHPFIGFAGMTSFDLTFNPDLTTRANRRQETLSQALETVAAKLEGLGFYQPESP